MNPAKELIDPIEVLRAMEAAASPAPWKPNPIYATEDNGAWGAGPYIEPDEAAQKQMDEGDWCQDDQLELARPDATLIATTRNLLPEMLALWEAVGRIWEPPAYVRDALAALNAKAASL